MQLYISKENLQVLISNLADTYKIFYPDTNLLYTEYLKNNPLNLNIDGIRPLVPLKTFFFNNGRNISNLDENITQKIIFGVKSCDLKALEILDKIFLEGVVVDPFYDINRKNTVIITSDCIEVCETCFCTLVRNKPYSESGYDINLTFIDNGYICETGTQKGEEIVKKNHTLFGSISEKVISLRDKQREKVINKLKEINIEFEKLFNIEYQKLLKDNYNSDQWNSFSEKCVQCMGCNFICPSCFCFFLHETKNFNKIRYWDGCHSTSYARVAGGANPRPKLYERFRNRYQCKLNNRKENFNVYACTGCGRCIQVCPAKIDIRKVLTQLVKV